MSLLRSLSFLVLTIAIFVACERSLTVAALAEEDVDASVTSIVDSSNQDAASQSDTDINDPPEDQ